MEGLKSICFFQVAWGDLDRYPVCACNVLIPKERRMELGSKNTDKKMEGGIHRQMKMRKVKGSLILCYF